MMGLPAIGRRAGQTPYELGAARLAFLLWESSRRYSASPVAGARWSGGVRREAGNLSPRSRRSSAAIAAETLPLFRPSSVKRTRTRGGWDPSGTPEAYQKRR